MKFIPRKLNLAILTALSASLPVTASAIELTPIEVQEDAEKAKQSTVYKEDLLQSGNTETGASLRRISGVGASRMGGHGLDIFVRGQKQSQLNILIDGAKIEGGCPNRMDPPTSYAEISSVDEIKVIKGVNSVTYGTGGSGGTVLFERKAPKFEDGKAYKGELNLGTSSNGLTQDISANVSAGGDKGYIVLQAAKKSADNYEDGNGNEINSSYKTRQGHIDLGWTPNKNHELRVSVENSLTEDALFEGAMMDSPKSDGTTTRLRYQGHNISEQITGLKLDVYNADVDHVMDNYSLRNSPNNDMKNVTDVTSKGAKLQATTALADTKIDFGVQYEAVEKLANLQTAMGMTAWYIWPDVEASTKSIFAEATKPLSDKQKIIVGLRYDQYSASEDLSNTATDMNKKAIGVYKGTYANFDGDTDVDQNGFNGLIRFENQLDNDMQFFAGLSRTHRFADATELYINRGAQNGAGTINFSWVGNPDLKPEQHNQFDIGVNGKGKNHRWEVSAFYDSVNNYILRDVGGAQSTNKLKAPMGGLADRRTVYLNKDATISGIEASANWMLSSKIDLSANVSFNNGRNESDDRNLSNLSPVNGNIDALYTESDWGIGTRLNFNADQNNVNKEFGELKTPGWSTMDVYGNYQVNKTFKISAGVDNLFDKAYENYLNRVDITSGSTYKIAEPGRVIWAKLNASF